MKLYILNACWGEDGYILCFANSKNEAMIFWEQNKNCKFFIDTYINFKNKEDLLKQIIEKEISLGIVDLE